MTSKIWFITGTSRGFGREWAIAALERGDKVVATARDTASVKDLVEQFGENILPIDLDVTDRTAVFAAVTQAHDHFGRLDIVVNNAGYGQFGMIEELSEQEARHQLETNVFGALWVTQAALPYLREQGSGHIVQVSSIGGISAFPNIGMYHASKWALEGFSQSLAQEVAPFGIKVTLIEPAGYSTDWGGASSKHTTPIAAYDDLRTAVAEQRKARTGIAGDPTATREAVLTVVDSPNPPLRIFFGDGVLGIAQRDYESRLATWREWEPTSIAAHGKKD
ncbi:NADP-dependent 3-hydroxy acid dehydrogenase YdfG [Jatrophihabitans sp. GAS493]|uniref:SDR family oxidoreductase n=1 Tax=Jatrophihabitans sp. GAS493 TaxID=1907575 RepID=UPI000BB7498E|nr:SDR family oxidoreductase [Jatrophihabitans sp. GAS493]SOD71680.1 NADP-dependent 3-hydroxy acid dehydrogenase YdfG [Jatrophihabitans sp. GAS493]